MRVALVHIARGVDGTPASPAVEHLGLSALAGSLEHAGHEVAIYDTMLQSLSDADIPALLESWGPNLTGFALNYSNKDVTLSVARECRRRLPEVPIVAGGHYSTFHCEQLLAQGEPFHAVVLGEGEVPLVRLAAASPTNWRDIPGIALLDEGKLHVSKPEPPPPFGLLPGRSLAQLGWLTRFPRGCYRVAVEASRGCSHACSFCSIAACQNMAGDIGRRRLRDPMSIAKEMRIIVEKFGLRDFWFMDADFLGTATEQEHVLATADAIGNLELDLSLEIDARADAVTPFLIERLRHAGLKRCFLGIESFDDATLRRFGKGTSEAINVRALDILETNGVRPIIGVIMFHPWSTKKQLRHDHARLRTIGYEKTQMLFRLKKYKGSNDAGQIDSDGKGVAPWADYGWEFDDPEIAEIWNAFDELRLKAMDDVFLGLTAKLRANVIDSSEFIREMDKIFNKFGEDVDTILG